MAWNMPKYTVTNFTFGPARVFIGEVGSDPSLTETNDIGGIRGNTSIIYSKTVLEIKQGSPQTVVQQYLMEEKARLTFSSLEALSKLSLLKAGLGGGEYSGVPGVGVETLGVGGIVTIEDKAIVVLHVTPNGTVVKYQIWRAQGKADMTMAFNETGETAIPFEFTIMDGLVDFDGEPIDEEASSRLFVIEKTNPGGGS